MPRPRATTLCWCSAAMAPSTKSSTACSRPDPRPTCRRWRSCQVAAPTSSPVRWDFPRLRWRRPANSSRRCAPGEAPGSDSARPTSAGSPSAPDSVWTPPRWPAWRNGGPRASARRRACTSAPRSTATSSAPTAGTPRSCCRCPVPPMQAPEPEPIFVGLVCNTSPWTYLGDRPVVPCPEASFDTGLDVMALRRLGLFTTLRASRRLLTGTAPRGRAVTLLHDAAGVHDLRDRRQPALPGRR